MYQSKLISIEHRYIYHSPTAPSDPPVNIIVMAVTETSVCLQWEEPPGCSWNGIITGYTLHIATVAPSHRRVHFGDFVTPLTNESTVMSFGGQLGAWMVHREISVPGTHAIIGDLQPTTVYSIAIAAATSEGIGPFSAPIIVSTLESGTRVCVCVWCMVAWCVCT